MRPRRGRRRSRVEERRRDPRRPRRGFPLDRRRGAAQSNRPRPQAVFRLARSDAWIRLAGGLRVLRDGPELERPAAAVRQHEGSRLRTPVAQSGRLAHRGHHRPRGLSAASVRGFSARRTRGGCCSSRRSASETQHGRTRAKRRDWSACRATRLSHRASMRRNFGDAARPPTCGNVEWWAGRRVGGSVRSDAFALPSPAWGGGERERGARTKRSDASARRTARRRPQSDDALLRPAASDRRA